ncbi:MAG: hypothetical protein B7Y59_02380 [Burkholderiales bacterium 35-55-47]|jgi:signal transduction histidine kinase|uniref:ATP-binding protein n=1 Tax=Limnohabitans sp. TaxID=1907725 RepID=UPI000BD19B48|nr:ATP-binding protein [Limnohabitans sp.]OYY19964.1 MAG: hypothetical protein B7Y59_02380 [Burkholderiales bacterium 35-55-47]OYZ74425.1 MAG: hypothetical protein B7Y06_02630 [Burkholderiales bacterium 24-55-52]OZB01684.1 MAG: hypothetical protein B7X62_02375 [Burkholderiales bacterium 39-55-53]HQR86184.1 hypothetical protein [Limnohabitans sp.]HQS25899.1 hypothetical protein [Limnohabitans sp.]
MIDPNQFLERFRTLQRDIQNSLQNLQKNTEAILLDKKLPEIEKILTGINEVTEYWQDFSGWVLISTLEDANEARKNCAPGRLDIASKIHRSKLKRRRDLTNSAIKIDTSNVSSIVIDTYIPYFEQLLDLIISNCIKYSPKGGSIEITTTLIGDSCKICFSSIGPLVANHEKPSLGFKGFRSEAAKKLAVTGDGFGLFNVKRIAELIGASTSFNPQTRTTMEFGGVPYANFEVTVSVPKTLKFVTH